MLNNNKALLRLAKWLYLFALLFIPPKIYLWGFMRGLQNYAGKCFVKMVIEHLMLVYSRGTVCQPTKMEKIASISSETKQANYVSKLHSEVSLAILGLWKYYHPWHFICSPWSLNWFFHTWFIRAKVFKNFHIILNDSLSLIICYFFLLYYTMLLSLAPHSSPILLFMSLAYFPYFLFPFFVSISWYIEWNLIYFFLRSVFESETCWIWQEFIPGTDFVHFK